MQRTGLIIKVSIALVGVMGSALAQNWHAHQQDNLAVTPIPQENRAYVETSDLSASQVDGVNVKSVKHVVKKSLSTRRKTNLSTTAHNAPSIDFSELVHSEPSQLSEVSPEVAVFSQSQNPSVQLDASRAATLLPALTEQPHTSPVPEASTSLGFGGMLVMGVGLMLFSSWKRSQKQ